MPNLAEFQPEDDQPRRPPNLVKLPWPLQNWQVLEIDSQASLLDISSETSERLSNDEQGNDQPDAVIVATLQTRALAVDVGETADFHLALLNNGGGVATFAVAVEGLAQTDWLPASLPSVRLRPGERTTVLLPIAPPKDNRSQAGDYPFQIIIDSPDYPERVAKVEALLQIKRNLDFKLSRVRPERLMTTWWRRRAMLRFVITNVGNGETTYQLRGYDTAQSCRFAFATRKGQLEQGNQGQATITLTAGQRLQTALEIKPYRLPIFRLQPATTSVRLFVHPQGAPQQARTIHAQLAMAPLIGPWQFVSALSLFFMSLIGAGLMGLLLFLAVGSRLWLRDTIPATAAPAPIAPPPIVVVIQQPVAAPATASSQSAVPAPATSLAPVAAPVVQVTQPNLIGHEPVNPALGAPLVKPEQVSAPGEAPGLVTAEQASSTGGAGATAQSTLTYGQMFQEIGQRYQWDWRMLAAQAYVESGFDSLALGRSGDMGLMQILPSTWREWAPAVDAADPFDSYSNVLVAAVYLDAIRTTLEKRGYSQPEWTLVAYNWGLDKVLSHLESGQGWNELPADRRQYAAEITRLAATIPEN